MAYNRPYGNIPFPDYSQSWTSELCAAKKARLPNQEDLSALQSIFKDAINQIRLDAKAGIYRSHIIWPIKSFSSTRLYLDPWLKKPNFSFTSLFLRSNPQRNLPTRLPRKHFNETLDRSFESYRIIERITKDNCRPRSLDFNARYCDAEKEPFFVSAYFNQSYFNWFWSPGGVFFLRVLSLSTARTVWVIPARYCITWYCNGTLWRTAYKAR